MNQYKFKIYSEWKVQEEQTLESIIIPQVEEENDIVR